MEYKPRETASFGFQWLRFFGRALLQQSRKIHFLLIDLLLVAVAGLFLGIVFSGKFQKTLCFKSMFKRFRVCFITGMTYIGPPDQFICDQIEVPQLKERCQLPIGNSSSFFIQSISTIFSFFLFFKKR